MTDPVKTSAEEQLFVVVSRSIRPSDFDKHGFLPEVSGSVRTYKAFKPTKLVLTESVEVTYSKDGLPDKTIEEYVGNDDVMVWQVYAGADNCFPCEPAAETAIPGATFAFESAGNEVNWPVVNAQINFTIGFLIGPGVLARVPAPPGYDLEPRRIVVRIGCKVYGPTLR